MSRCTATHDRSAHGLLRCGKADRHVGKHQQGHWQWSSPRSPLEYVARPVHTDDEPDHIIVAKSPAQREALSWMLDKPLPEGYEDIGLNPNDEWGQYVHADGRIDGMPQTVSIPARYIDAWWDELADGHRIAADQADALPEWRTQALALRQIADRYGIDL